MSFFVRLSLSHKLMAVTMLVTVVAMLSGFVVVVINEYRVLKSNALDQALLITKTVGNYSTADIAFLDQISSVKTLSYLQTIPSVISADIFDQQKSHFSSLQDLPSLFVAPDGITSWHDFQGGKLYVVEKITDAGRDFGYIQIGFSTSTLQDKLLSSVFMMLLVLLGLLLLALMLSNRLQRVISIPLLNLADISRRVARDADYSVRVKHDANDEIGTLYTAFNSMLKQIANRDISQQISRTALQQSEEQWRSITEYSPDYIMRIDKLGSILFINRSFFAYEQSIISGMNIFDLFSVEYHEVMAESHKYVWETGEPVSYRATYVSGEGVIHFESNVGPVFHDGNVISLTVSIRDISSRIKTEEDLSRFRAALDSTDDNVFIIDPEKMRFIDFNQAAVGDLGYSRAQLLEIGPQDIAPQYTANAFHNVFQSVLHSDEGIGEVSTIHRSKDGREFHVEMRLSIWHPKGEAPLIIAMARDVTERLKSEVIIRQLSRAVDQTTDTVIITDKNGVIEYVNLAFTAETGFTATEALGKTPAILSSGETPESVYQDMWKTISSGKRWQGELLNRKKDGGTYWEFASVSPIKNDNNEITHYLGIQMDISERKRTEEELANYRDHLEDLVKGRTEELEAVNKELEAFAYSVSHDLRAPLRSIDGFGLMLLEDYAGDLDEEAQSYIKRIRSNTEKMAKLISDILELSRLGRSELKMTMVDLGEIAREVMQTLKDGQPGRDVKITIQEGLSVQGDQTLLKVVLMNLLGNAWKYSSKTTNASIEFGAMREPGETVYFVKDNGAGFDEKYADKLFVVFSRLHAASEFEGTGVGLATVARVIHRHRGRVWGEGKVNEGAIFFFTLGG